MQKNKKKNITDDIKEGNREDSNSSPASSSFLKSLMKDKKFVLLLFASLFFFGAVYLIEKGFFEAIFHKIDEHFILSEGKRLLDSAETDEEAFRALEKISEAQSYKSEAQSYKSAEFLVQVLKGEETKKVRAAAAKLLGRQGIYDFEDDLIEALNDSDIAVRVEAAKALGEGRSWKAVNYLIKALEDDKTIVQDAAHGALYALCLHRGDYSPLIEALKSSSLGISYRAAVILGELKAKEAVSHITPLLKSDNAFLREKAVIALGEIREPASILPLKEMLIDPEEDVIIKALEALSKFEGTEDILKKALLHESERTRSRPAYCPQQKPYGRNGRDPFRIGKG